MKGLFSTSGGKGGNACGLWPSLAKAGAYAIQEHGDRILDRIDGRYRNVMGLPMERLRGTLEKLGIV